MADFPIRVGFFAPSRAMPDVGQTVRIATFFNDRGGDVVFDETVFCRHRQFSGTDEERLAGLMRMVEDDSLDAILAIRGGYGLSRLLDRIDWQALRKRNPIFCGFSDFTAFNLAYFAHTGCVSYQGPTGTSFVETVPTLTEMSFHNALFDTRWAVDFETTYPESLNLEGTLWGGNLTMLMSLLGTEHFPQVDEGILFLEDCNERAYRLERMLLQLDMAGVLRRQKAIIFGHFRDADPKVFQADDFMWADARAHIQSRLKGIPIIEGLPFGHIAERVTMPVGARTRLSVHKGKVQLSSDDHPIVQLCSHVVD